VRLRGSAALPRLLLTRVIRGKAGCGQAYASRVASPRLVAVRWVKRAIGFSVRTRPFTRPGTYTVCAYLQEQVDEPRAERIARRIVRVVR
jgi:hypothetical protein